MANRRTSERRLDIQFGSASQGRLDGQMLFATILDEGEELNEELLGPSKPVAKGAPHGQVIGEGLTEEVLDGSEHDGTLAVVGMTMSRGARFCSVEDLAPPPCIRWTIEVRNHDAWMRVGERSSEAADPFCYAA